MTKMPLRTYIQRVVRETLQQQEEGPQHPDETSQEHQPEEHPLPVHCQISQAGHVFDFGENVQMIPLPSVNCLRRLRDYRSVTKLCRQKRDFTLRIQPFVDAIRSSLVNRSVCEVRRRSGFDNIVTYRISYRPQAERLPLTTVRATEAEWNIILRQLKLDGHRIATSPDGERILIKLD